MPKKSFLLFAPVVVLQHAPGVAAARLGDGPMTLQKTDGMLFIVTDESENPGQRRKAADCNGHDIPGKLDCVAITDCSSVIGGIPYPPCNGAN